jgi:hypothetical protein
MTAPQDPHAPLSLADLAAALPPRIWYLTSNGVDMWCRRPYGFWFSTGEAAEAFAREAGSEHGLMALGTDASDLLIDATFEALRELGVTRVFLDPAIDAETGDVHGRILRLGGWN